jgi:hypothetical protein
MELCTGCQFLTVQQSKADTYYFYEYFCSSNGKAQIIFRRLEAQELEDAYVCPKPDRCPKEMEQDE